ncbi:MAG: hypothetical protein KDK66_02660 [Deltaproteobacteria bacterium]|nr:hypothetical protein [Deltaproteobacteria bacterium]
MKSKRLIWLSSLLVILLVVALWQFWPKSKKSNKDQGLIGTEEIKDFGEVESKKESPPQAPLPSQAPPTTAPVSAPPPSSLLVKAPDRLSVAEGSSFYLQGFQVTYQGKNKLVYDWKLIKGPSDKIEWVKLPESPSELQILIGNLSEKTDFVISLKVSDGVQEAEDRVTLTGVPAKLKLVQQLGGELLDLQALGDQWLALWGRSLQLYSNQGSLIQRAQLDFVPQALFVPQPATLKEFLVQDKQGDWYWIQLGEEGIQSQRQLPMLGNKVSYLKSLNLRGKPYALARLPEGVELWNFEDARKPKLKNSLKISLDPQARLALWEQSLFVVGEQEIQVYELTSSRLLASLPSGGSPQDLQIISWKQKNYLALSIGQDRTGQARQDYGLQLFEISTDGRLGSARRLPLKEPMESFLWLANGYFVFNFANLPSKAFDFNFTEKSISLPSLSALGPYPQLWRSSYINQIQVWLRGASALALINLSDLKGELLETHSSVDEVLWLKAQGDTDLWLGEKRSGTYTLKLLSQADLSLKQAWSLAGELRNLVVFKKQALILSHGEEEKATLGSIALISPVTSNASQASQELQAPSKKLSWLPGEWGSSLSDKQIMAWDLDFKETQQKQNLAVAVSASPSGGDQEGVLFWSQKAGDDLNKLLVQDLSEQSQLLNQSGAKNLSLSQDGRALIVAAGLNGLVVFDLERLQVVTRLSFGEAWSVSRVEISPTGNLVLASIVELATGRTVLKLFSINPDLRLEEYANLGDLPSWQSHQTWENSSWALTYDDYYLFLPKRGGKLEVYNLSLPTKPFAIAELNLGSEVLSVTLAKQFKEVFVALGKDGLAKLNFGF